MKYICEQDKCKQPMECFQGSCYTIHCSLHMNYRYNDDEPGQIVCPRGSLARIETKEKNEFIMKFLSKSEDEGCIALSRADNWAWKDLDCEKHYPVLCEEPFGLFVKI
ncbi:hypothetical protein RRG08_040272 [Elysia crispata]|uniref:C-type lectin domain-containing protein n=1 Tax=Elysia crispata TaxID=231223 RepID=A0AAE0YAS2_9GAST|nr:hypothetical protein RRG08_040272 [Elysia crispata]